MRQYKKWKICLTLFALALLTAAAGAFWDGAEPVTAVVVFEDGADPAQMAEKIAAVQGAEFLWEYDTFFCGAAVEADGGALREIEAMEGVDGVARAAVYENEITAAKDPELTSREGLSLMGMDELWDQGCTGDGLVIAVIDSGVNTSHEVFSDDSLVKNPALTAGDIADFVQKGGTAGKYLSAKIPFAYDYYSNDADVKTSNQHGTHVTALAGGYAQGRDGEDGFRGAAPGAQILSMKIFPDGSGSGTNDAIILRALEDAWNLGADVVNISVGILAGFSQADDMDGLYSRAFRQIAESGTIICCAAGNSKPAAAYKNWSQPLPTGAYTDYSSVYSPASLYGAVGVGAASQKEGEASIADYTSWGPASGLHLCPAITGFGGPLRSASATDGGAYRGEAGTSMASGSMSGSYAVLLQALRARGITDKRQAAETARGLVEGTASILTDASSGLPVSPRRQGAGYVDLSAAARSGLVIVNPLLELGDSEEGVFTASITLRNLTENPVSASLSVKALTDGYQMEDGTYYSLMTPKDITGGVAVSGGDGVVIPAGGEAEAALRLEVTEGLREELSQVYANGFYVEGYITVNGGNEPVHATFLGYCGDWEAAPVLEPYDFRDVEDAEHRLAGGEAVKRADKEITQKDLWKELGVDTGANLAYLAPEKGAGWEKGVLLGANSRIYAAHDDSRNRVPARGGDPAENPYLQLRLYSQRNAAGVVMLVSDPETGEVYYASDERLLEKSTQLSRSGGVAPSAEFTWDVTGRGKSLPDGAKVRVDVYAWLDTDKGIEAAYQEKVRTSDPSTYGWLLEDGYEAYRELSFPVTVDGKAPTVTAAVSGKALTVTAADEGSAAWVQVKDEGGKVLAEGFGTGASCAVTVDFSGGTAPEKVYIEAEDYASHRAEYELDVKTLLAGGSALPRRTSAGGLTDVSSGAWYGEAVDYVVKEGIMEPDASGAFRPSAPASRMEIVTALHRANGRPASKLSGGDLPFTDITPSSGDAEALCWAYENKVVTGRDDGTFDPGAGVSRQELAVMLYRCASLHGKPEVSGELGAFSDASNVAGWASEGMAWAVGEGLIKGDDAGKLIPASGVTRAQTAQILMRFASGK